MDITELKTEIDKLTKTTLELKNHVANLSETIATQNKTIMALLNKQQSTLQALAVNSGGIGKTRNKTEPDNISLSTYPITEQKQLEKLENDINESNTELFVNTFKMLLKNGGLKKGLSNIFSTEIIMEYNVDGIHSKKRLLNYPQILDIMYKAVPNENMTFKMFLAELRAAIKLVKNKHFKNVCMQRKKLRELREQMKNEEMDFEEKFEEIYF